MCCKYRPQGTVEIHLGPVCCEWLTPFFLPAPGGGGVPFPSCPGSSDLLKVVQLAMLGPEGPSLRKRTVRNENMGRIRSISGGNDWFRFDSGLSRLFAACSHGVQSTLHGISRFSLAYCTQQTGGLTRGMTLRAIRATPADAPGEPSWMAAFLVSLACDHLASAPPLTRPTTLRAIR